MLKHIKITRRIVLPIIGLGLCGFISYAQPGQHELIPSLAECKATLTGNILILENSRMVRSYEWNLGNIKSLSLQDKITNYTWNFSSKQADAVFPGTEKSSGGHLEVRSVPATAISPTHLEAEVTTSLGALMVKRVYRIYPGCPAFACDYYLKGNVKARWLTTTVSSGDLRNIETRAAEAEGEAKATVMETIALPGKHWRVRAAQFFDITDRNNNLVQEVDQLSYRGESRLKGNVIFADEMLTDHGLFILKEAPTSDVQLAYPGFDFLVRTGNLQAVGIGVLPEELSANKWLRCYGVVTGVTSGGPLGRMSALRTYQQQIRTHLPGRDDMILMNTWGDRNQDKHIGEAFTLKELEAAHKLGITHFQIDDGWQTGRSANSAFTGGSFNRIWQNPDYWKPSVQKFPKGLTPVVQLGKRLGIEVCVWFNPSKDSSYAHWKQDAGALINLYKQYGIRTFKIDGVQVSDKAGEINLRSMLDTVMSVTNNQAVFNLDVTAGRRYGYHYFNQYGNIFLENRYTDYGNYYPHWTLRNLWMLSRYVPPQNLQIEFLNNFRNADKYPADDVLAPSKVSFEYEFALTMMAQPLAWMEATGLPEEAFRIAPVVQKYQRLQAAIHAGQIYPIGDEPSGTSWTGFQSMNNNKGYLLIVRELNKQEDIRLKTWFDPGKKISCKTLLGSGKDQIVTVGNDRTIPVTLHTPNSYVLYQYQVIN
jgi:alpha-galactosidase